MCVKHLGVAVSCENCTLVNKLPVSLPVLPCLTQVDRVLYSGSSKKLRKMISMKKKTRQTLFKKLALE